MKLPRWLAPVDQMQTSYIIRRRDTVENKSVLEVQVYGDRVRVMAIAQEFNKIVTQEGLE